jgi:drug/metabolite transporter (DMT)-like permease
MFLLVLCAALVHATWNALVKADPDRLAAVKTMSVSQLVLSLVLLPFVPAPSTEGWPYLVASPVFSTAYMLFLSRAYQAGDLSHVYPLARGAAPLIVTAVTVGLLGEQLGFAAQLAVLLIALGVASLMLTKGAAGLRDPRPVLLALATAAFIAGYTVIDGLGARAAGSASGYMVWVSLFTAPLIVACVQWLQRTRRRTMSARSRRTGILSGLMSYASSWLVIWAMTLAPLAMVSALRETGVVFAVIIGVVFLKEQLSLTRLASIATTLIGTTLLKFSR